MLCLLRSSLCTLREQADLTLQIETNCSSCGFPSGEFGHSATNAPSGMQPYAVSCFFHHLFVSLATQSRYYYRHRF
jgi:hypothetical protein